MIFVWLLRPFVFAINQIVSWMMALAKLELKTSKDEGLTREN